MIGNIEYDKFKNIINILEKANNNIKQIILLNNKDIENQSIKMNRFSQEVDNYIKFLKNTYQINIDADKALNNLKELNN